MWRKPTLLDRLPQYMKMYPPCEHPQLSPHPPNQKQNSQTIPKKSLFPIFHKTTQTSPTPST